MSGARWVKALAAAVLVAVLLGGLWLAFRDSGFVRVHRATVTGVTGARAERIRAAALSQTTLNPDRGALMEAGAGQPPIRTITVETAFPDTMTVHVSLFQPVAAVTNGGAPAIAVAGDGTILRGVSTEGLPTVDGIAGAGTVRTSDAAQVIKVLAGAPPALLARCARGFVDPGRGVVVAMRNGPKVYFGSSQLADRKWEALARVLADPGSAGASYVDVTVPRRPAVGGVAGGVIGGVDPADPNQPVGQPTDSGSQDQGQGDQSAAGQ